MQRKIEDVLECQSGIKHHGLLAGNHLAVYGVVEMTNLQEKIIHTALHANLLSNVCNGGEVPCIDYNNIMHVMS